MKAQYFLVCLIGIFISNFSFSVESKKVFSAETYGEAFSLLQSSQISFAEDLKKGDQGLENSVYIYIPENESSERILVICGGMGPEAGLLAWVKAIQIFPKRKIVLDQRCSIPDRSTAIEAGLESQKSKDLALHLSLSLEFASSFWSSESTVDVFVACNTAHAFLPMALEYLKESIKDKIKIYSLIDSASKSASKVKQKALVLSTTGTLKTGLYKKVLEELSVGFLKLPPENQKFLMKAIYHGVKHGNQELSLQYGFSALRFLTELEKKVSIIAACTEIPILIQMMRKENILNLDSFKIIDPVSEVLFLIRSNSLG